MKQTITTQRTSPRWLHMRLFGLICAFLLPGYLGMQAQKVTWTSGYPQTVPATLVALGDPGAIEVNLTVTQAIPNAKVEVALPANVAYASVSDGSGLTSGITYTASATGTVAAGQTISIIFNSDGGSLPLGKVVHLKVNVNAQCIENTSLTTEIKVISGSTEIADATKSAPTPIRKPVIRLQCSNSSIAGGATSTPQLFTMMLDAQIVTVNSLKLVFSTDQYTTLNNFMLGSTPLTATIAGTTTKTFTLSLNATNMGGGLGTTAKTLTFDVVSDRCGAHNITSSIQYPEASVCATATGTPLSITYDGISGSPVMALSSVAWVDPTNLDQSISSSAISLDGINPGWMRVAYKNNGLVDSYNTTITFQASHGSSQYGYLDVNNIQYAIGSGSKKLLKDNGIIKETVWLDDDNSYRKLKLSAKSKPLSATLNVTEAIPPGGIVYYYIPVIQGDIYDNASLSESIIISTPYYYVNYCYYSLTYYENICGVPGVNPGSESGYGAIAASRFTSIGQPISLRSGGISRETNFKFYISGVGSTDLNIELPSWLELNGTLSSAVSFSSAVTTQEILSDDTNKKYTLRISGGFNGTVTLKYKSIATCPALVNENKEGNIILSIDYNTYITLGDPGRPTLKKLGQLVIPATLLCKEEGFVLTDYSILRTSKGLKDTNNENLAEDGNIAPDNAIDHSSFMQNDEGKMVYEGYIVGSSSSTFDYLYVLISSEGANLTSNITLSQATLEIGTNSYPVSFVQVSDTRHFYLKYTGTDIKGGNQVKITLPFKVNLAVSTGIVFTAEAYTSNNDIPAASVFTPTSIQRNGEDVMYRNLFSYSLATVRDGNTGNVTITNNTKREFTLPYLDTYHANNFSSPFFKNEYRVVAVPTKIEVTVPNGILVDDTDQLRMYVQSVQDAHGMLNRSQYVNLLSTESVSGGKKYIYDFSSVYEPNYDLTQGSLAITKWAYPAEAWAYYWYLKMMVTKGAAISNSVKTTVYYDDKTFNIVRSSDSNFTIIYNASRTTINVSPSSMETYSSNISIPSVILGNPNGSAMRMWLYVGGDVKNVKATPVEGGAAISGTGYNNCWIPLGTVASNGAPAYNLDFTYTGSGNCDPYNVTVYTICDFGDGSYDPATGSAMVFDIDHNGAYQEIKVTPNPNAALTGSLSIPTSTVLSYQTPYTVTTTFNSVASEAGVNNAEMLITVPAGQQYVSGSAKFVYPTTASPVAASAIESALVAYLGSGSNLTLDRTFTLKASDLGVNELPGYKVTGYNDIARELKVTMDFTSECGTELSGIRFTGTISGKNPCGGSIPSSDVRTEQLIYTNVTAAYAFDVTASMDASGPVFNEKKTTSTLTITVQKLGNDPVQTTDYLMVTLPEGLNITGGATSVSLSGTLPGVTSATVTDNAVASGVRTLKLSLPASTFTGSLNGGNYLNVIYSIPLTYTPSGQSYASTPVHKIAPRVLSNQKFAPACSGTSEVAIGRTELEVALVTALSNTANACLNTAKVLEITSTGFQGSWYDNPSASGTAFSTTSSYSYTPTDQLTGDKTFYVSAIFNGTDYGIVPVEVVMHLEATITVTAPVAQCSASSNVDLTTTVSGTPAGSTLAYYSDDAGNSVLPNTTVTPAVTTTYYTQVTTTEGCTSAVTPVVVTVTQTPSMTASTDQTVCTGAANAINLASLGTNTTHFTWTGGSSIGLADEDGSTTPKTQIPSFPAVNTTAAPVTATISVTPQNTANGVTCAGTTQSFTITVNPLPVAGTFSNVSVCSGITQPAISLTTGTAVTYYTWSGGSGVGLADYTGTDKLTIPSFIAASVTTATIATITVVPHYVNNSVTCDGASTTFTVTVNPLPVVTLVTDKTDDKVCVNTDITFTTESGMTGYTWNLGGATTTTSGGTSISPTATLQWSTAGTKTVSVNYTNSNGCTATAVTTKTITVLPSTAITTQPTVDPSIKLPNGYIIPGSNVVLNVVAVGDNLTYQWSWKKLSDNTTVSLSDGGKYSSTTSASLTISNTYEAENGDYYVVVTGTCGTVTSTPVTVVAVANQDASLKDLKVNGVTLPDFNAAKVNYIHLATCEEDQVTITGTSNNANVTSITGNGTYSLEPGDNYLRIRIVAQDMVTTMTYTVNVIRDCYVPKITKDLEDAIVCINDDHTFEITAEGEGLTYEWYYGNRRILGANSNTYTVTNAKLNDYERYYVIIRNNYNGYQASVYSKNVRLWIAESLPESLQFSDYPLLVARTGNTYHIKLAGYSDVTKYSWSYSKEGVTFTPETGGKGENETWVTFGTLSEGTGTLTATLEHPCGTRQATQTIKVQYPTGTDNITTTSIQVSPNPTLGLIKVSNTESNQTIRIMDVTGSLKGTYQTQEGTTTIDLTGYAKGTYMLQYNAKTSKVIRK